MIEIVGDDQKALRELGIAFEKPECLLRGGPANRCGIDAPAGESLATAAARPQLHHVPVLSAGYRVRKVESHLPDLVVAHPHHGFDAPAGESLATAAARPQLHHVPVLSAGYRVMMK